MAMNKKEQAAFDAAIKAVFVARALNWTELVKPDMGLPETHEDLLGFVPHSYSGTVAYARSSRVSHATSDGDFPKKTTSQNPIFMHSTKLRALRALRHLVELECANKLAKIDMQIAAELEKK
jgi:hypothetical protein